MTADEVILDAPIVAVTVYPRGARVTRKGVIEVRAGEGRVVLDDLPIQLEAESVRVAGRGDLTVHGVDVGRRHHPEAPDPAVAALIARRNELTDRQSEIADALDIEDGRATFLDGLAHHAGATFARQLAAGRPADPAAFADSVAAQHNSVRARKRELRNALASVERELAATERELDERAAQRYPDRLGVTVTVLAASAGSVELEVSYVVHGARWTSAYDVRQSGDRLAVTWYGLVVQQTAEDWPECDLALSTARVATSLQVPDLEPWYLERRRPLPPPLPTRAGGADYGAPQPAAAPMMMRAAEITGSQAPVVQATATAEQGTVAATYRPVRPVGVPADGEAHRATIAVLDMASELDYVTVPVIAPETYLRATANNSSEYTLLPGRASIFHDAEFVGVTDLDVWAPGEEVELALGIDDRVRVERELVRRTAGRGFTSSKREATYRIEVTNHTPRQAKITVRDQVPVSRDDAITVKDVRYEPRPAETTDLGEVTWQLTLEPGRKADLTTSFRVEVAKGIDLQNWRD